MPDTSLHQRSDAALGAALRDLAPAIAWPTSGAAGEPDLAAMVRVRVESLPVPSQRRGAGRWAPLEWRPGLRPARRALVLALAALLALAAIAGAVGLGLPGLRLILGEGPATFAPSLTPATNAPAASNPGPLGQSLQLGEALDPDDPESLDGRAGFHVSMPGEPAIGPPDAAWIDPQRGGQVTLLWATRDDLSATSERNVGLLLGQFPGTMDSGYFNKVVSAGTVVERVRVAGKQGYWLSGDPHVFFWEGPGGFVDDPRRWVGDVLLWSDGEITYRLETSLGREDAIRIAESFR
jgi:hypothetical protein